MADKPGLLGWFISNPIAANLLMVVLVIGGLYNIPGLDKQFFPTPVIDRVSITMPFPGASPREVEEQICVRIEEAIHDLDGIKEIRSTASEGMGQVVVEALTGYPTQRLTNEIKTRVDAITTFPTDAERPVVTELIYRHLLGIVQLAGDLDEWELKETTRDSVCAATGHQQAQIPTLVQLCLCAASVVRLRQHMRPSRATATWRTAERRPRRLPIPCAAWMYVRCKGAACRQWT